MPPPEELRAARERVTGLIRRTPVLELTSGDVAELGARGEWGDDDTRILLKLELTQHTGSFKARGALNALLSLAEAGAPADGVVAASGGNHGAALAWAAARARIPAHVFVPGTSPPLKADRIRSYGAEVSVVEGHYPQALAASQEWAEGRDTRQVHAYDDPSVVAGASTLGAELAEQVPDATAVLVSCGGGGLFAGTTLGIDERAPVIPVEPELCPALHSAVSAGGPVTVSVAGVAADSMGAARAGGIAHSVAAARGVQPVLVPDEAIVAARAYLWERYRVLAEPGGVTAFAAVLAGAWRPEPRDGPGVVVVVVSGSNHADLP